MTFIPFLLLIFWLGFLSICFALDARRRRGLAPALPVSVLIPCHNGAQTIAQTVESVFAAWPADRLEVHVINDASTDHTAEILTHLASRFPLRITHQTENLGKTRSLNRAVPSCRHAHILFLDADTSLNPAALQEMLVRIARKEGPAAVSCPCTPSNRGILPAMQTLEYNMHRLFIGAGNLFSVQALWGGCLMTRASVFQSLQGFAHNAVAEDTDYAFRLNQRGHRVEQCAQRVLTLVPSKLSHWVRQKIRWTAGIFQCGFRYPRVWAASPVILLTLFVNLVLFPNMLAGWFNGFSGLDLIQTVQKLYDRNLSFLATLQAFARQDAAMAYLFNLLIGLTIVLFSIVYVRPQMTRFSDAAKLALLGPFLFGYMPLFAIVSAAGFVFWVLKLRKLNEQQRAW